MRVVAAGSPIYAHTVNATPFLAGLAARGVAADMQGLAFKQVSGPALRGGANAAPPGSGGGPDAVVPEIPMTALLPVAAMLIAGTVVARRRQLLG